MAARPHAFVAMPFGSKPGCRTASQLIDFNRVYTSTSRRRSKSAGLEPFRADQEMRAGDIRTDMFQELLVADLVVADLTHRQSQRLVRARRPPRAARSRRRDRLRRQRDDRVRPLHRSQAALRPQGRRARSRARSKSDKRKLADDGQGHDGLLARPQDQPGLPPAAESAGAGLEIAAHRRRPRVLGAARRVGAADRRSPAGPDASATCWCWPTRRRSRRFASMPGSRPARRCAGPSASSSRSSTCSTVSRAIRTNPGRPARDGHLPAAARARRRGRPFARSRARSTTATRSSIYPARSRDVGAARSRRQGCLDRRLAPRGTDAASRCARTPPTRTRCCARAIDSYTTGIPHQPGTLLLRHQRADADAPVSPSDRRRALRPGRWTTMAGAVRFAAGARRTISQLFWAKATLGDLEVLVGTPETVTTAYKEAIAKNDKDWFALNSSSRAAAAAEGPRLPARTTSRPASPCSIARSRGSRSPQDSWQPRQVILFSGHMVDAPDRAGAALSRRQGVDRGAEDRRGARAARRRSGRPRALPGRGRRRPAVPRGVPEARRALPGAAAASRSPSSSNGRSCRRPAATHGASASFR